MADMNVLVNPSQQQVHEAQMRASRRAGELSNTITGVSGENQALVREILPDVDLASGVDNSWNGTQREWEQLSLTADQENDCYSIDSNDEAQDKVIVFYGFANVSSDPLSTEVLFNDGTGATFFRANAQVTEVAEISDFVLYDKMIVYGSTEDGNVLQWPNSAGDDNVVHLAKVAEPLGNTISTRESAGSRLASR